MTDPFTPQAAKIWEQIPAFAKTRILNNIWCGRCKRGTTIVHFTGSVENGDLILRGECERCGGAVARLMERE